MQFDTGKYGETRSKKKKREKVHSKYLIYSHICDMIGRVIVTSSGPKYFASLRDNKIFKSKRFLPFDHLEQRKSQTSIRLIPCLFIETADEVI